ncbi:HAMP domain-containing protein [Nocardiopsis mwathae]|uniref:HAMP domain-containing protein n=1 Tax=Nocardiopsis mwathae TaxID=1472723 RepID=A0A7X0D5H1_9ACTN|nr:HAMP domain-containing protein [Nocardiopsis mwathae]
MHTSHAVDTLAAALRAAETNRAAAAWERLTPKQRKIIRTTHELCELTASTTLLADPDVPSPTGWDRTWAAARLAFSRACQAAGIAEDDALDAIA